MFGSTIILSSQIVIRFFYSKSIMSFNTSLSPVKLKMQATSVGEVVIKGVFANRYLAMNRDGRLFGAVSDFSYCCFSFIIIMHQIRGVNQQL